MTENEAPVKITLYTIDHRECFQDFFDALDPLEQQVCLFKSTFATFVFWAPLSRRNTLNPVLDLLVQLL